MRAVRCLRLGTTEGEVCRVSGNSGAVSIEVVVVVNHGFDF